MFQGIYDQPVYLCQTSADPGIWNLEFNTAVMGYWQAVEKN